MEARRAQGVENHLGRQIELVEGVGSEHARAVDRVAARRVLFEERHAESTAREQRRQVQTAGSAAHDGYISHADRKGAPPARRSQRE